MRYALDVSRRSSDYPAFLAQELSFNLRFRSKCQRFRQHSSLAEDLEEKLLDKQRLLIQLQDQYFRQLQSLKQLNNQLVSTNKQLELQLFTLKLELEKEKARSLMFSHQLERLQHTRLSPLHSALRLLKTSLDKLQPQQQDQWDAATLEKELSLIEEQVGKANMDKLDTLLQDLLDSRNSNNNPKFSVCGNHKSLQDSFSQGLSLSHD